MATSPADVQASAIEQMQEYSESIVQNTGIEVEKNIEKAIACFTQRNPKSAIDHYWLGVCYFKQEEYKKAVESFKCFRIANEPGHTLHEVEHSMDDPALDQPFDLKVIAELMERSEQLGWAKKMINKVTDELGLAYKLKRIYRIVMQSLAYEYLLRVARQSSTDISSDALYELGHCYAKGLGVTQDQKAAIEYFTKSAQKGNINAKRKLQNRLQTSGSPILINYASASAAGAAAPFADVAIAPAKSTEQKPAPSTPK